MAGDARRELQEGYDRLAETYAARIAGELAHKPFDREVLDRFAALAGHDGPVVDAGCGPGHVARHLSDRGVLVTGIDLSHQMVEQAATLNPGIPFRQGAMETLPAGGELAGIVAFYSIIHVPREEQPAMFATWRAALRPGGYLIVAFHVGEHDRHIEEFWGHSVSIDFLFFGRVEIEERLRAAGFVIVESHEREAYPEVEVETRRAYILAQRPASTNARGVR